MPRFSAIIWNIFFKYIISEYNNCGFNYLFIIENIKLLN